MRGDPLPRVPRPKARGRASDERNGDLIRVVVVAVIVIAAAGFAQTGRDSSAREPLGAESTASASRSAQVGALSRADSSSAPAGTSIPSASSPSAAARTARVSGADALESSAPDSLSVPESGNPFGSGLSTSGVVARSVTLAVAGADQLAGATVSPAAAGAGGAAHSARSCKAARKALRWFVRWTNEWRDRMGAGTSQAQKEPCPRTLAKRWRAKAVAARAQYVRWYALRGATIRRLDRGLRGSPMAGLGAVLERHGRRHGVSPYFMVAVAATESSIGRAACSSNRRNVWGLASCVNSWPVPYFDTWDEAISFYAHFLASRWPGHSTPYSFNGYAACSDCWARKVSYWMRALFGVSALTRYP